MTPDPVSFLVGLVAGFAIAYLARRETIDVLLAQLGQARGAEALATDRLVHAWQEGARIPPRPAPEPEPVQPLPEILQKELDDWEDPEHRAMLEATMRAGLQKGQDPVRILMELDNLHP